jgi:hypothetical protein
MEPHATRLVVWDTPSAVECGAPLRFKVGVQCAAECRVADWRVAIRDAAGHAVTSVAIGDAPAPGTSAVYFADIEVRAPESEGLHAWEAAVADCSAAVEGAAPHAGASARFNIRTVPAPECLVKVVAVDAVSRAPVPGARVVVHPYRAVTNADGVAEIRVPKGAYRLFVSGRDYFPFRSDGEVRDDVTIHAELDVDRGPSDAELWT